MSLLRSLAVRVGQVGHALAARWQALDETPLVVLTPGERALFDRLPRADRLHAVRVAGRLAQAGQRHPSLLKAALLHDVGKAGQGIHLPHRVARVVLTAVAPGLLARLTATPTGWRRPLYALVNHARLGAIWTLEAGSDPLTVALVGYHDAATWPTDLVEYSTLWRALKLADDEG